MHDHSAIPRLATYARQSVGEDQGISQQLDDTRAEAQRRGWPIVAEYVDNDTSATKARGETTEWARMLRSFDAGEFDALMVTETSRLTRSLTDVLEVRPPRRDMRIVAIHQSIDTATDDFALKLLVLVAEEEVKRKTQRARRYAEERRKDGHPTPGKTPYGYKWVPAIDRDVDGVRYVIVDSEAAVVRRVFSEFLAGAPLAQIARDLNGESARTRRDTRWGATSIRRILLNPAYAALLAPAQPTGSYDAASIDLDACRPGAWEPVISRDQLVATRARLVGVKPRHSGTARRWLLSGLAVCSVCRQPARSARGETHPTVRKDGSGAAPQQRYHAYRCPRGHFMRNGDVIDDYVARVCIGRIAQPDTIKLIEPESTGRDVATLNGLRDDLAARERAIVRLIATGKLSDTAAEQELDGLRGEMSALDAEIAVALTRDPLAEVALIDGVEAASAWWESATLARRRNVVEALMIVLIHPVGHGRRILTDAQAAETTDIEWRR